MARTQKTVIVNGGSHEILQDIFGKEKDHFGLVYGVASLPLGTPRRLEVIFEVSA
jgi:hypothetical protein